MTGLAVAAGSAARAQASAPSLPPTAALDSAIESRMSEAGFMGLAAAVLVNKQVVWMKGYGFADWRRTKPYTPQTIQNIASISKTVTGAAMMRAVAEGKLNLDEDINRYLPFRVVNPRFPNERITLRHLATHTSGITDRYEVYSRAYQFGGDSPEPMGRFVEDYFTPDGKNFSRDNFIDAKPGAMREYSNIGAALAAYILERAVGEPLNTYTKKHIFTPLGMTGTGWFLTEVDRAKHSELFVAQNGSPVPIPHYGLTTFADGGVRTSVADLSKFFAAMLNGGEYRGTRILDARAAAEMTHLQYTATNHPENLPPSEGNSGLFWRTKYGGARVGHGGNDPGVKADMLADHSGNTGVVVLINTSTSFAGAEQQAYFALFEVLWKYAESVRGAGR